MSDGKPNCIYGLLDPYIGQFFYVGITENRETRLASHISAAKFKAQKGKPLTLFYKYLLDMMSRGQMPIFVVIEELDNDKTPKIIRANSERFWMYHLKQVGHPITNVHNMNYMVHKPHLYGDGFEYRLNKYFNEAVRT